MIKNILFLFLAFGLLTSCEKDDSIDNSSKRQFGIFKLLDDNNTIEMNGTIGSSSLKDFNRLHANHTTVKTINIINCDGSSDDTVNLLLSKRVHDLSLSIHILDNGTIASGGVDFFLAGKKRTRGKNTKIGVHSWSDGTNEATNFPVGHANHLPYINYYKSIGFTQKQAEDFYYFTINVASAANIHWMTSEEIEKYGIIKE
ncbi:hypothetical protein [Flagellimonas pacifica]|uniref:Uncharacterized protein n=1 Tax=Flagellimonas pacifica TaxID=1247520 RepID=A0A285MUY4_9FLAO|nr:hypothetical protein [Allomuricauda parva]SNZ00994.1 hypothetical protein SAMN06265377_2824 [Allomuricauda parva]